MKTSSRPPVQRRNKGFDETHQEMIETAVRLISEKGVEALSIAALARATGVNRTTVYYHFESREALLDVVKTWSSKQLAKGMQVQSPRQERMDYISRFVLDNPDLIKLWIDDFLSPGHIKDSYPQWDALVAGMKDRLAAEFPNEEFDAEVYCVNMLASAIIGPRVFKNRVRPDADIDTIVKLFRIEQQHMLRLDT